MAPDSVETCSDTMLVSGDTAPSMAVFETTIQDYMMEHAIPNASVAFMSGDDTLVLNRSYTYGCGGEIHSDGRLDSPPEETTTASRFRVGSISKLITATVVLMIAESGLGLNLSDPLVQHITLTPVVDVDGDGIVDTQDPRIEEITVTDALRHRAGWNCRSEDEPGFIGDPSKLDFEIVEAFSNAGTEVRLPIGVAHILGYIATAPMAWDPGTHSDYCSVGYTMLGEIIGVTTGLGYAAAVNEWLLSPLGMDSTTPGNTALDARLDDEVLYADHRPSSEDSVLVAGDSAPRPYGGTFNLENRLASGGWVSTASELVRFGRAFMEGALVDSPADVMGDDWGWPDKFARREGSTGHTGSLEGSHALLMCFGPDDPNPVIANACWAALFNKSPPRAVTDPVTEEMTEPRHELAYLLANEILGTLTSL